VKLKRRAELLKERLRPSDPRCAGRESYRLGLSSDWLACVTVLDNGQMKVKVLMKYRGTRVTILCLEQRR
jgi:hypothetical protein